MATFVIRDGQLVDKRFAAPLHHADAAPFVRPDGMDPVQSMASGRMHDSRSTYYAELKRGGYEIVGNDRRSFDAQRPSAGPCTVERDIARAYDRLSSRDR